MSIKFHIRLGIGYQMKFNAIQLDANVLLRELHGFAYAYYLQFFHTSIGLKLSKCKALRYLSLYNDVKINLRLSSLR